MLWKEVAHKDLTAGQARELLAKGETAKPVKGLTSKAGKTFEARLKLDRETGRVSFIFDPRPTVPEGQGHAPARTGSGRGAHARGPTRSGAQR